MNKSHQINGPKLIDRAIRPPRIAFIVATVQDCKRIMDSCCMSWGGKYFLIVPCDQDHKITDTWMNVIYKYDPDTIYSTVKLENFTESLLLETVSTKYLFSNEKRNSIPVIDHIIQNEVPTYGITLFSVLTGLGSLEKKEAFPPVLLPKVDENDPLEIFVKARYGTINQNAMSSILVNDDFNNFHLELDDFIRVESPSVNASNYLDFIIDRETRLIHGDDCLPLIDYTLSGLTQQVQGREIRQFGDPNILFDAQNLLFITAGSSIEDFCWYWNLRSQRYFTPHTHKLPLWLPLETVRNNIEKIARVIFFGERPGYLISNSVSIDDLYETASSLGDKVFSFNGGLERFYADEFFVGIKDKTEVYFDENRSIVPIPTSDTVKFGNKPHSYYFVDVNVPNIKLPRINNASWGNWNYIGYRVSRTGLSFSERSSVSSNLLDVIIPTPWEMLETFTGLAGYEVKTSDKGRLAEKMLELIAGIDQAWILSGQTIYTLLDQLSDLSQSKEFKQRLKSSGLQDGEVDDLIQRIADDRHERVQKVAGDIKRILEFNQTTTSNFIFWMLKNHLLFRGMEVSCPNCKTKQWIVIHDLDEKMFCKGCQQQVDTRINIISTTWQYRINTFLAKVFEQGIIPHILTIRYAIDEDHSSVESNIVSVFYGVQISAKEGFVLPYKEKEIDVAWISNGQLTIGECKTNGKELSLEEVEAYIKIAASIKASRIVFSVLDSFDSIGEPVQEAIKQSPLPTMIITKDELFNQHPHRPTSREVNLGIFPKPTYQDYVDILSSYLDWSVKTSL